MPSFEIDTPQLVIEPSGSLQVGISNSANQARTCRLEIASEDAEAAGWIAISPWQERNLQPNERSEITLSLTLPPGAAAGPRRFRLLAVEVSNPDEDVARSPDFRFEVPGSGGGGKLPLWPFIAAGVAALLLVIGVGAYLFWPAGTAQVPGLSGLTLAAAEARLEAEDLAVGRVDRRESGSVAPGTVLAQDPGEGAELAPGSEVALTVATEPARAEVPNLVGLSQDRARNVLRDRGLRMGGTATRESGSVAPGTVLAQDPGEGAELAPGSAVAVVLAAAPRVTVDEDCIRHNPGNIAAKQIGGRWKIVDGSHWMLDFGTDADSAKKVLAVLKAYGADRICYVSRPQPPMMYILNGDRAPIRTPATRLQLMTAGLVREDCIGFDPATLDLESGGAGVTLVNDRSRMIRFRNMDEAKKAMLVIRKHGFTRQCFVGRPNPEFKYFLR
ncbi:PASTA domain-containing protein [Rhodovulum sulfidophilum]|nr:PASTA domain-containing protein [Rhodovulum sulfidophilum]